MGNLYGMIFHIPAQREIIDRICFGECKRILFGAAVDNEIGELCLCRIDAANCPAFDRELNEPCGDVNGEPLYIRKLKLPAQEGEE